MILESLANTAMIYKIYGIDRDGEEFFLGRYSQEWSAEQAADSFANQFANAIDEIVVRASKK